MTDLQLGNVKGGAGSWDYIWRKRLEFRLKLGWCREKTSKA